MRTLIGIVAMMAAPLSAIAADPLTIKVDTLFDRPNMSLTFVRQDTMKPLESDPILLQLDDLVTVQVTEPQNAGASIVVDRWEATETWEEKKKKGKTTTYTQVTFDHRLPIEVHLGNQVKITTAFKVTSPGLPVPPSGEIGIAATAPTPVPSAKTELRLATLVNTNAPPPTLTHAGWPKSGWVKAPERKPVAQDKEKWYTITVTIQRN
jgi:hypothetical protein